VVATSAISRFFFCGSISITLCAGFLTACLYGVNGTNISTSKMATDVWGQLAKAQDDATTIDEAVATAIAEHEADSESHLGTGESLQSHRATEIIDHAVGSVLADKMSYTEGIYETIFESLDQWYKLGTVELISFANAQIYCDGAPTTHSQMYGQIPHPYGNFTLEKDWQMQTTAGVYYDNSTTFNFGIGYAGGAPSNVSSGFYFDGSDWKAYHRDGSTVHYSGALTINNETQYVFRVQNFSGEGVLRWYVNGVAVFEYEYPDNTLVHSTMIFYDVTLTTGESWIDAFKVSFSESVI